MWPRLCGTGTKFGTRNSKAVGIRRECWVSEVTGHRSNSSARGFLRFNYHHQRGGDQNGYSRRSLAHALDVRCLRQLVAAPNYLWYTQMSPSASEMTSNVTSWMNIRHPLVIFSLQHIVLVQYSISFIPVLFPTTQRLSPLQKWLWSVNHDSENIWMSTLIIASSWH